MKGGGHTAGRGSARGSQAKGGVGPGGLETEPPGFWEEEAARPAGQPWARQGQLRPTSGWDLRQLPGRPRHTACSVLVLFPQRHSVTLRHTPELNLALSTRNGLPQRPPPHARRGRGPSPPDRSHPFIFTVKGVSRPVTVMTPSWVRGARPSLQVESKHQHPADRAVTETLAAEPDAVLRSRRSSWAPFCLSWSS